MMKKTTWLVALMSIVVLWGMGASLGAGFKGSVDVVRQTEVACSYSFGQIADVRISDCAVKFMGWGDPLLGPNPGDTWDRALYNYWIDIENKGDTAIAIDLMFILSDWQKQVIYTRWRSRLFVDPHTIMRYDGTFRCRISQGQCDKVAHYDWMFRPSCLLEEHSKWKFEPREYMAWLLWKELSKGR